MDSSWCLCCTPFSVSEYTLVSLINATVGTAQIIGIRQVYLFPITLRSNGKKIHHITQNIVVLREQSDGLNHQNVVLHRLSVQSCHCTRWQPQSCKNKINVQKDFLSYDVFKHLVSTLYGFWTNCIFFFTLGELVVHHRMGSIRTI